MLKALLSLIFLRPFISSLAFPYLNFIYSALLLLFLIIWVFYKGIPWKSLLTIKYPLFFFCSILMFSATFSFNKLNGLKELSEYAVNILLFLATISLIRKDKFRLMNILLWAAFIISLLAIYQYFFGFQHTLKYLAQEKITNPFVLDYIKSKRVFFPFVTPNILAGYLIMAIPLALTNKRKVWMVIILSCALLLTKSLGALLSLLLALILYFYLQDNFKKRGILLLLGILIIIGLVFLARTNTLKQHLQPFFSTTARLQYYKDTWGIIKTAPLAGVGLGNFNLTLSRYAHNSYLQIWAETGIFGLISLLWLVGAVLKYGLQNIKTSSCKNITAGLVVTAAVFLLHNLVDFTFFLPEVSFFWWVTLGLLIPREN